MVIWESGYTLPGGDQPKTHARIAHANNWHSDGTITASTTDTDYFLDAPDTSLTFERWKPTSLPTTGATWETDLTTSHDADYCVIAAHTLGTSGCTVKAEYWTGSAWADMCPATAITTDAPIFIITTQKSATKFRVNITAGTSNPEIGVIKFGEALQMPRPIYGGHTPVDFARQTQFRSNYSEQGEFLGKTRQRTYLSASYAWSNLTAAWIRSNWRSFQTALESDPCVIAWRPDTYGEVALVDVKEAPIPTNSGPRDLMSVTVTGTAHSYD